MFMIDRDYWTAFEQTGSVDDYLNYKRSLGADGAEGDEYEHEDDDRRFGNMGEQDWRGRQGDYPFDA
jgi:hypothetical protein